MKLRNILLVDDEKFVRKGLKVIIEKSGIIYNEIRECIDGSEALEIMAKEEFDVVITDIRMPNINGIAFLREAQKFEYKPKFIILSGYHNFNNAVECIKYGAHAYLVKPVKKEELFQALGKIEKEICKEQNIKRNSDKLNNLLTRARENEINMIFLNENLKEGEIRDIIHTVEIDDFNNEFYIGVLIGWDISSCLKSDSRPLELKDHVHNFIVGINTTQLYFSGIDGEVMIVSNRESFFKDLMDHLKLYHSNAYAIGLSEAGYGLNDIRKAYLQGKEALKYQILRNNGEIICFHDIKNLNNRYSIPIDSIKRIYQFVCAGKIREIENILNVIFDDKIINSNAINFIEEVTNNFNEHVFRPLIESISDKQTDIVKEYENIKKIYNYYYIKDYLNAIREYILKIVDYLKAMKDNKEKSELDDAIKYIKENYYKQLSLAQVSNHVSLNYSYFSHRFKEYTEMSFVNYLRKVRIDKARELLDTTNYKIFEVSRKVGYENPKQFTRAFKSVIGVSPIEYSNHLF